jgi:hypothetical protein
MEVMMRILAKPDELHRSSVDEDHGRADAFGRRSRRMDDLLTVERRIEVVYLERHVRQRLDRRVKWAALRVSHPFDAERAGREAGNVKLEGFEVLLVRTGFVGGYADVVIAPPELSDDRRGLVVETVD